MSTRLLSREYVKELNEHIYVKSATQRTVNFTAEFKSYAYEELHKGKTIREIFKEAGFDIEKLGQKRLENFQTKVEKLAQRESGFLICDVAIIGTKVKVMKQSSKND